MNWRLIINYGSIAGLIIVSTWFIGYFLSGDGLGGSSELIGYIIMVLALTTVFLGVKKEKDQRAGDRFSFKDGFITGLSIVSVASVIYVLGWLIYMPTFDPDFVENYTNAQIAQVENSSMSKIDKQTKIEEITSFAASYRNPFFMALMTFIEIFPVGIIVALISALILKTRNKAPIDT